jgi:hypothetical protein
LAKYVEKIIYYSVGLPLLGTKDNELGRIPQNGEGGHGIILRDSIDSLKLKR